MNLDIRLLRAKDIGRAKRNNQRLFVSVFFSAVNERNMLQTSGQVDRFLLVLLL
jgi:hypothetical protein